MRCPACGRTMREMKAGGVTLDVCQDGCGGTWFDRFELKRMDEPGETGEELINAIRVDRSVRTDRARRKKCPKCRDLVMMRHCFSVRAEVDVDECPGCAGFWLDHGELRKIRSLFDSEECRNEAAKEFFSGVFDGMLKEMREESEGYHSRARNFANLLRFLCPSSLLPGRQRWGAF